MTRFGTWKSDFSTPLHALQRELNKLLEEYWTTHPFAHPSNRTAAASDASGWSPPIDLYEAPDSFELLVDLPGTTPESIELSATGRVLTLRGRKEAETSKPEPDQTVHKQERVSGAFFRQVNLPSDIDINSIRAEIRDGILRVHLSKGESAKPRTIPIQTT